MRNVLLLALNTLKVTFRKKGNIIIFLVLPVVSVLVTVFLYNQGDPKINIGIYNMDKNGNLASDMIASIKSQDKFKVIEVTPDKINSMVAEGNVDCEVTIPADFSENVLNQKIDKLQINTIKGQDATAWIQNYLNYYVRSLEDISKAANGDKTKFDLMYESFQKQELKVSVGQVNDKQLSKTITAQSMGFLVMFMLLGATNTSGFILKEKKERTYFRVLASPVSSKSYIGGNVLANMIIMAIQTAVFIFAATVLFKLNTNVPDLELFIILYAFGLVSIALGVLLVAFSKTSYQSGTMATLIITPTCMVSGCFWPVDFMPPFMQKISNFLPQRWTLEAIKSLQNGKTFIEIIPYLSIILAFAAAFFFIGIYKMRSSNSVQNFV